jgi:serine/threonine protein kinase/WD40 repeat protein/Flp pilus assembly protein TadD
LARLADEFADRYRRGERPSLQEYLDKYPDLAPDIRQLFRAMVEIEQVKVDRCATRDPELPGTLPALRQLGDFRIIREIGRGGMGVVYEAEQVSLGRHVALKMLPQNLFIDPRQKRRFEREAKAAAKLHHTNIVPVFGVGEDEKLSYYVMQFIHGLGLDQVLDELKRLPQPEKQAAAPPKKVEPRAKQRDVSVADVARSMLTGKFTPADSAESENRANRETTPPERGLPPELPAVNGGPDSVSLSSSSAVLPGQSDNARKPRARKPTYYESVAQIGVQVADALDYAHNQKVLHRDIKPSNLLLDSHGTVWVTDFGLAKADDQQNLTHTGDILGTLRYMSPEAFDGRADNRSDVYALGLTLYELLALRPAFDERDRPKLIKQVTTAEPPPLGKLNAEVPRDLETIVHKAIERDPFHRYQAAGQLAADLLHFLNDEPITARRSSLTEQLVRAARRHKGVAASLAVVALLLVVIATGSLAAAAYFGRLAAEKDKLARENGELATAQGAEAERARHAKDEADAARREAQRRFYSSQIILASHALQRGQPTKALELLERERPFAGEEDFRTFEWYYLWHELHRDHRGSLPGHSGGCYRLALAPDGETLASGDGAGRVKLWNTSTRELRRTWQAHTGVVLSLGFSPDGTKLACGAPDGRISWWDPASGKMQGAVAVGVPCHALAWRKDGKNLVLGCDDGSIRRLNLQTLAVDESFKPHGARVSRLLLTPDDKLLVSSRYGDGKGGATLVHDLATWPPRPVLPALSEPSGALGLALSPDGRFLALARYDFIVVWDLHAGKERCPRLNGHYGMVQGLAFSPDGKLLLSGCFEDRTVILWDAVTGRELTRRANRFAVQDVVALPPGRGWAVGGAGEDVNVWDPGASDGAAFLTVEGARGAALLDPDGKSFITGGAMDPRRWALATGKATGRLVTTGWFIGLSADGTRLLTSPGMDNELGMETLQVVETASGKILATLPLGAKGKRPAVIAPDGQWVAAGGGLVWDLRGPKPRQAYRPPQGFGCLVGSTDPGDLAISPDSVTLAVGCNLGKVQLWSLATGQLIAEFKHGLEQHVSAVAFSPDGSILASADEAGVIRFWELKTRQLLGTAKGDVEIVAMAFFPDGRVLACGREDGAVLFLDVFTCQEQMTVRAHAAPVSSLAVAPDGKTLISATCYGNVRIWRTGNDAEAPARKNPLDRDDPESPVAEKERGDQFHQSGHDAEAEQAYRSAIGRFAHLARTFHDRSDYTRWLAVTQMALGEMLLDGGQGDRALPALLQARDGWDQALMKIPDNPDCRGERFRVAVQLLPLLLDAQRPNDAERERRLVQTSLPADGARCNDVARELVESPGSNPSCITRAVKLARAAVELNPAYRPWQQTLGVACYRAGQWSDAAVALEKSVALSGGAGLAADPFWLAMVHAQQGNRHLALKWLRLGQFWVERLEPKVTPAQPNRFLAEAAALVGVPERASDLPPPSDKNQRELLDMMLELAPGAADLPENLHALASSARDDAQQLEKVGRLAAAEQACRRAIELWSKLATDHPDRRESRKLLAYAHWQLAFLLAAQGRPGEAEEVYRRSVGHWQKLSDEWPEDNGYRSELAQSHYFLGSNLRAGDRAEEAEKALREAVAQQEKVVSSVPADIGFQLRLVMYHDLMAGLFKDTGRPLDAFEAARRALDITAKVAAQHPKHQADAAVRQQALARSQWDSAEQLAKAGRSADAEQAYGRAIAVWAMSTTDQPNTRENREQLARAHGKLAEILAIQKRPKVAEQANGRALDCWQKLAADFPLEPNYRVELGHSLWQLANLFSGLGRYGDAEKFHRDALGVFAKLATDFPAVAFYRQEQGFSYWHLGWLMNNSGRRHDAEEPFRQAANVYAKLAADFPKEPEYQTRLARSWSELGAVLLRQGRHVEAERAYGKGLEAAPQNAPAFNNVAWLLATCPEAKIRDPKRAVELGKKAVELAPKEGMFWNTLGVAEYRAGDMKAAIVGLEKSVELRSGGDSFDWFFLAMAHRRLGKLDLARKWHAYAVAWMAKNNPKDEELQRFRTEAVELLGADVKSIDAKSAEPGPIDVYSLILETDAAALWACARHAELCAQAKDWDRARSDYAKLAAAGTDDVFGVCYPLALLDLRTGRSDDYRSLCEGLLDRFHQTDNEAIGLWVVITCKLAPDAVRDPARLTKLAEKLLARDPKNAHSIGLLGDVLYRNGDLRAAVEKLEASIHGDTGIGKHWRKLFLAMAYHRLGRAAEAEKSFREVEQWMAAKEYAQLAWAARLDLQLLREEVEGLLGLKKHKELPRTAQ